MEAEYEETYDDGAEEVYEPEEGFEDDVADGVIDPVAGGPKPSSETQALLTHHPEIWVDYAEAITEKLLKPKRTCYPFLTQFERTKVLSFRSSQLAQGAKPFIEVADDITDVYTIARMELKAKKLPFIIKRPLPDGDYEYWRLTELEVFD
uniref:RNA polymerase Rpb6 n=1 Tax=viral metagenome TaxID=1070528 RepID=A0A6C0DT50_9ZZZZ